MKVVRENAKAKEVDPKVGRVPAAVFDCGSALPYLVQIPDQIGFNDCIIVRGKYEFRFFG